MKQFNSLGVELLRRLGDSFSSEDVVRCVTYSIYIAFFTEL